ncbi:MAG TPA: hypothetical protein VL175_11955 [Pirellulales bacterium]|jgi:hypothetical protein|nr:hypothetical protein [Pirellulales bacterium]
MFLNSSDDSASAAVERRDAYRCRAPGARSARLRLGKQKFEVAVLDESANGYAVSLVSQRPIECQVGQRLLLTLDGETLEVTVANVSSETIPPTGPNEPPIIRARLGLTRAAEYSARRIATAKRPRLFATTPLHRIWAAVVCLFLIAMAIAVLTGLLGDLQHSVSYWFYRLQ